jgi:antibiotic biosynthesis monooxygenase (ABM) superfamily enzyme
VGGVTTGAILAVLFLCNFCGYVVLTTALYLPVLHRLQHVTRVLLIGFTAVTFIAYFAIDRGHALQPFGLADKAVEATLIVLLIIEGRRARD